MTHLLSGHGPDEAGLEPGARGLLADAGWLRQAYVDQGWTCREIAATVGASPRSVSRALQRAGVPRRPSGTRPGSVPLPPPLDDATWLHRRYTVERRSMREIAQQAGVGQAVVARALLQYGIAARRGGRRDADQPELKDAERLRHLLIDRGLTVAEVAGLLQVPEVDVRKACVRNEVRLPRQAATSPRRKKRHPQLWDETWLGQRRQQDGMRVTAIANAIGCSHSEVSRALDRYGLR